MKCLERSVSQHIRDCLPLSLDPYQFAYRANRSTEDTIALTLHTALSHLENKKSYVRMLFVDYSSAFNTIILDILITKLLEIQIPLPTCNWIRNFLSSRPQSVRLHRPPPLHCTHTQHWFPSRLHSEPSTVRPTALLNMRMTPQWLDSFEARTRQRTGPRWRNCRYGAQTTT